MMFIDSDEAMKILNVSYRTLVRIAARGDFKALVFKGKRGGGGKKVRYLLSEVEACRDRRKLEASTLPSGSNKRL